MKTNIERKAIASVWTMSWIIIILITMRTHHFVLWGSMEGKEKPYQNASSSNNEPEFWSGSNPRFYSACQNISYGTKNP